jgi:anti-anti-sigma factor
MLVIERYHPSTLVLTLSGRFDQKGDMALETAMLRGEDKNVLHVVFNLAKISTIDTAGIGRLYVTFFRLKQKGIYLSLVNPKPAVQTILDLVEIPKIIQVFESDEAALAWLDTESQVRSDPTVSPWVVSSEDDPSKQSTWSHTSPTEASA